MGLKVRKLDIAGDECSGVQVCCSVRLPDYGSEKTMKRRSAEARGRRSAVVQQHRVDIAHERGVVSSRGSENI